MVVSNRQSYKVRCVNHCPFSLSLKGSSCPGGSKRAAAWQRTAWTCRRFGVCALHTHERMKAADQDNGSIHRWLRSGLPLGSTRHKIGGQPLGKAVEVKCVCCAAALPEILANPDQCVSLLIEDICEANRKARQAAQLSGIICKKTSQDGAEVDTFELRHILQQ
eukprot:scaffold52970_cov46-Prasinocladus_malaysianus.AAC.1